MVGILTVSSKLSPFPYAALAIAAFTQTADVVFDESAKGLALELDGDKLQVEEDIVHALAKAGALSDHSVKVLCFSLYFVLVVTSHRNIQTPSYFALANSLQKTAAYPDLVAALDSLDDHLAFRTFLIGHEVTSADWIIWGTLKGLFNHL